MKLQSYNPPNAVEDEKRSTTSGTLLLSGLIVVALISLVYISTLKETKKWSEDTEKYWANVSTLVTTSGAIAGLWFVWFKFVRARNFAQKVEISFSSDKILLENGIENLHVISIKLDNKGLKSIEKYKLEPELYFHKESVSINPVDKVDCHLFPDQFSTSRQSSDQFIPILDVGSCSFAHCVFKVGKVQADAITFGLKMTAIDSKVEWKNFITISNIIKLEKFIDNAKSSTQNTENL
jgi:hypothetical protein